MNRQTRYARFAAVATLALGGGAMANPVDGGYFDGPLCDNHGPLVAREELGLLGIFPPDEAIDSFAQPTQLIACPMTDDPTVPNALVTMLNLTTKHWTDLFYVADPETTFSNIDGDAFSVLAPGVTTPAMRIDFLGGNKPLVFESMTPDGIFEPGETWQFIVQDYGNAFGISPAAFASLDFAGASGGDSLSAASIVQLVPAPGSAGLLCAAGLLGLRRRRG